MGRMKVGVLVSGRGSNLQALIDACADADFPAEIALVISNVSDAGALDRAARADIPSTLIDHRWTPDRAVYGDRLDQALRDAEIELVCLAGFMRILDAGFVERWSGRMLNVHPSLLPAFKGLDTHQQAIDAGVRIAGCSVHLVTPDLDDGPILAQAAVPVLPNDTADDLAARVLVQEHRLYPMALRAIAEGRVEVDGRFSQIDGADFPSGALRSPEA